MSVGSISEHDVGTDLLRTLVVVVEERSYTKAASKLGLSQPTVSAHIRRLQEQLGYEVFDKRVPGVKLTHRGEQALVIARQILALHEGLVRYTDPASGTRNRIRLGAPKEIRWNLTPILTVLRRENPGVNFLIEHYSSQDLLAKLHGGELDVCAVTQLQPLGPGSHSNWRENLVWVGSMHSSASLNPVDIVAAPKDCLCRDIMLDALSRSGTPYRIVVETNTMEEAFNAVGEGLGYFALLPSNILPPLAALPANSGLPPITTPYYWGVFINPQTRTVATEQLANYITERMTTDNMKIAALLASG